MHFACIKQVILFPCLGSNKINTIDTSQTGDLFSDGVFEAIKMDNEQSVRNVEILALNIYFYKKNNSIACRCLNYNSMQE